MNSINQPSKGLVVALWIVQVLTGLGFIAAGFMKLTTPIPELSKMMPWTGDAAEWFVRVMGIIDLAGGVGLILPALTRIKPQLTVAAAIGCVALQICAMIFHITRGEGAMMAPTNLILLALAAFIWWGRSRKAPIAARA